MCEVKATLYATSYSHDLAAYRRGTEMQKAVTLSF
jgi:hypothetical protein